jgi:hypothetical protein
MNTNHKDSIRVKSIPDDVDLTRTLMCHALLPASAVPGAFSSAGLRPALADAPHAVTLLRAPRAPAGMAALLQGLCNGLLGVRRLSSSARFRTIQVYPKDIGALGGHTRSVDRPKPLE